MRAEVPGRDADKMRHCPLALDNSMSTSEDIDGGVRFDHPEAMNERWGEPPG